MKIERHKTGTYGLLTGLRGHFSCVCGLCTDCGAQSLCNHIFFCPGNHREMAVDWITGWSLYSVFSRGWKTRDACQQPNHVLRHHVPVVLPRFPGPQSADNAHLLRWWRHRRADHEPCWRKWARDQSPEDRTQDNRRNQGSRHRGLL